MTPKWKFGFKDIVELGDIMYTIHNISHMGMILYDGHMNVCVNILNTIYILHYFYGFNG